MISCKRAAALISQSLETPLGARHRLGLGIHLYFCGMCRRFRCQSELLQQFGHLAGQAERAGLATAVTLSDTARERIKQVLWQEGQGRGE
ncbi:MAG TPA: hypothetical protein VKU02_25905 [Gemmataceae bacterium]|nr:hypothetical protein [Gemmataceae bacterium]